MISASKADRFTEKIIIKIADIHLNEEVVLTLGQPLFF